MYPETDIPPIPISGTRLQRLRSALPERPAARLARLESHHGLSRELLRQIVYGGLADAFEALTANGHAAGLVARLLVQDVPAVPARPDGTAFEPSLEQLDRILSAANRGRFGKEGIPRVLLALALGSPDVDAAITATGLEGLSSDDLASLVERIVRDQASMIRARGSEAFSPLMGDVMKEVRGRRDGREVAEELRKAIAKVLGEAPSGSSGAGA